MSVPIEAPVSFSNVGITMTTIAAMSAQKASVKPQRRILFIVAKRTAILSLRFAQAISFGEGRKSISPTIQPRTAPINSATMNAGT